jgi:hypothetical protein
VAAVLDARGRVLHGPTVTSYGVPCLDGDARALGLVATDARLALERGATQRSLAVEEVARRAVRRTVHELSGVRAVVEIALVRAE